MRSLIFMLLGLMSTPFKGFGADKNFIREAAKSYGIDPALMLAFAEVESSFNVRAIRYEPKIKTYSVGLFQVLYPTAQSMGFKGSLENLMKPEVNIMFAAKYIKKCANRFSSVPYIACCYNAGSAVKESVCKNNASVKIYMNKIKASHEKWLAISSQR